MFEILLLDFLCEMSDARMVEYGAARLSFRQVLRMGPGVMASYDTTLMKFRKRVCDKGLFDRLFAEEWT